MGDELLSSDGGAVAGRIVSVQAERVEPEMWLYRVQYQPNPDVAHPIWGYVVYRVPEEAKKPEPKHNGHPVEKTNDGLLFPTNRVHIGKAANLVGATQ